MANTFLLELWELSRADWLLFIVDKSVDSCLVSL